MTLVITPPGRLNLPEWHEVWEAREVLYRFGVRDVVLRYRQTAVGVIWVVLQPLVAAVVFAVVFSRVAGLPTGGVPALLFAYTGMLAWNLFNGVVTRASSSLVANGALVSKVFFPRILVPLSSTLAVLLDFAVAACLYVVLLVVYGVNPGWRVLAAVPLLVVALLLANGIAVAASAIMVKYRDVAYALPWVLQILLYATPVAYSLDAVPADLRWLFQLNPLTWLLDAFRWALLGLAAPPVWQLIALPCAAVVVFLGGTLVFQKMERGFADVI